MNRADALLSCLKDGQPWTRRDIFDRVGFMLTNNAASELRARGIDVTHEVRRGEHVYRLGPEQLTLENAA